MSHRAASPTPLSCSCSHARDPGSGVLEGNHHPLFTDCLRTREDTSGGLCVWPRKDWGNRGCWENAYKSNVSQVILIDTPVPQAAAFVCVCPLKILGETLARLVQPLICEAFPTGCPVEPNSTTFSPTLQISLSEKHQQAALELLYQMGLWEPLDW